jgi:hypothetical protein
MSKTKLEITEAVLKELSEYSEYHTLPIEQVVFNWWATGRSGQGLRLTDMGYQAFTQANIAHYKFPLFSNKTDYNSILNNPNSYTLSLSKKIKCPFYITKLNKAVVKSEPEIIIYDDKIAMWMTLYGTLQEYLDSVR